MTEFDKTENVQIGHVPQCKARSFYLVDSSTYQPRSPDEKLTVIYAGAGGNDYDTVSPSTERADEGPRHPDHGDTHAWHRFRSNYQDFFSEFFGVFILILFGDGSVAQVVLAGGTKGEFYSIPWAWGIGVMLGAYTARRSGAHLNPAVTLCFCIFRKFSWKKLPIYVAAQVLGALVAAALVYGNYKSAFDAFAGQNVLIVPGGPGNQTLATAGIFNTYPADFLLPLGQFFSEVLASAILLFCVFAILDEGNIGASPFLPIGLFFIIFGIGSSFGWQTGFAINPARDFGPRLMTYMLGYGTSVWSVGHHYFWVPIIGPVIGTIVGAFFYDFFIFQGESPVNKPWFGLRSHKKSATAGSPV